MRLIIDLVLPGIVLGCLYGMIGMAFAIVYKSTGVVNFALGEMMMLTAYIAYSLQSAVAPSAYLLLLTTVVASALIGALVERLVIRPMQSEPLFSIVMATIGLAILLRSLVVLLWGALPQANASGLPDTFVDVWGVGFTMDQLLLAATLALSCVAMFAFFRYSRFGLAMRATASNETTAMLMGIRVARVQTVAWVLSSVIAGIAGVLSASIYRLVPEMYLVGLKGFPATIMGGLDSVLGSALGGILIGVVENLAGGLLGSGFKEIAGFSIIIGVLMLRPYGLFGQQRIERV